MAMLASSASAFAGASVGAARSGPAAARPARSTTSAGLFDFLKPQPKEAKAPKTVSVSSRDVDPEAYKRKDLSLRINGVKAFGGTNRLVTSLKTPRTFALNPKGYKKATFSELEED